MLLLPAKFGSSEIVAVGCVIGSGPLLSSAEWLSVLEATASAPRIAEQRLVDDFAVEQRAPTHEWLGMRLGAAKP